MFVTDKFAFVHLPRTGGSFVIEVITKFFPKAREVGHHLPLELVPSQYRHLPILGTVRNPWDFYVSLYHYIAKADPASILGSWMSENGTVGFRESARNLLNFGTNNDRLDALIEMLPERVDYSKRQLPNISKDKTRKIRGSGLGYYSFRFGEMFGNADNVFFCKLETLRQDLVGFFEKLHVATDELRDYVLRLDKKNASEHLHYSSYYSPELADLVLARERPIIEKFAYQFDPDSNRPGFQKIRETYS
jgi:hypothetical protein